MRKEKNVSFEHTALVRPRLNALIKEGKGRSFLMITAGTGYGKTQAITDYIAGTKDKTMLMQLSNLDSHPSYFWNHLIRALKADFSELAKNLTKLGFVDTVSKFDIFVKHLANAIPENRQVFWVFDDFNRISDKSVYSFFEMLAALELQGFHAVIITSNLATNDAITLMSSRAGLISSDDLRFTKEEIAEFYKLNGIPFESSDVDAIERYTEGWPLALSVLSQRSDRENHVGLHPPKSLNKEITSIFEENFFHAYTLNQQHLLAQLSLMDFFAKEFIIMLYKGDVEELTVFDDNIFIREEASTGHMFFHQMYRMFLQTQQHLLEEDDKHQLWKYAAEYYESSGYIMEAIRAFRRCEDHPGMLRCIFEYIRTNNEMPAEYAPFFLECFDLLTEAEFEENPMAEHLRALIYMYLWDFDQSELLLKELEAKLLKKDDPDSRNVLAEVYGALGNIHMMRMQDDYGKLYEKAISYNPEGSMIINNKKLTLRNNNCFSIPDNLPGTRERTERLIQEAMPFMQQFLRGSTSGGEHLFLAEAAYLTMDLESARQHAFKAIFRAEAYGQHDLVCNGYSILARTAFMEGDFGELNQHINSIVQYAEICEDGDVNEIKDTALRWYYMKMHDDARMPPGIAGISDSGDPLFANARTQIIYANHLLHNGEYAKMVGLLEYPKGFLTGSAITIDKIGRYILLAVGYLALGDIANAVKAMWTCYDITYHNDLIVVFVEAERYMLQLIEYARTRTEYDFDPKWLDRIYKEAGDFAERSKTVRTAYQKINPVRVTGKANLLSKREQEVLRAIAKGRTREEIAVEQYVSINTVKSTIRNIYNKLDANNKADAVSIAIANGYIDAYKKEYS